MATIPEIVFVVETRLSLSPGANVQIHAEPKFRSLIRQAMVFLFDEYWWSQFMTITPVQIDESTSFPVTNVSTFIKRYVDIRDVYYESETTPLPRAPLAFNPGQLRRRSLYPYELDTTKMFRVLPTLGGGVPALANVTVVSRIRPAFDLFTDVVQLPFDDELLVLYVCWKYMVSDGTNSVMEEDFQRDYVKRLDTLIKAQQTIEHTFGGSYSVQSTWEEVSPWP